MRKLFMNFMFVFAILFAIASSAYAADCYEVTACTYYSDGNTAEVAITKQADVQGGDVVVALYTEDNRFLAYSNTAIPSASIGESTTVKIPFEIDDDSNVAKVKAMVWDSMSTFNPLSAPKLGKITRMLYNGDSDFAVAAANASVASGAVVDGEDVYTLRVIKDGASKAEILYISPEAKVYYDTYGSYMNYNSYYPSTVGNFLKKGSAFFYTTDQYGLVDRIDIVLNGQTTFDAYRNTPLTTLVQTPDRFTPEVIDMADWYVTVDGTGILPSNNLIQLFVAPVLYAGDNYVAFSAMASDAYGQYVDTNVEYLYDIALDANIYYYDMSPSAPVNHVAFSKGEFTGIDLGEVSSSGKAYVDDVYGEYNFDEMLQVAFVMVVDGKVTNALVIGKTHAEGDAEYIKSLSYADLTEYRLKIKKEGSLTVDEYDLTIGATELYINDNFFMTLDSSNISTAQSILNAAFGEIAVCENTSTSSKEYNKIMVDIYGLAKINQVTVNEGSTVVRLSSTTLPYVSGFGQMGNAFTIYDDEGRATVTRNGVSTDVSSLQKGDIVAIKYDVTGSVNLSEKIEILATTDTAEGQYTYYDDILDLYEFDGEMYCAATSLNTISRGSYYKLYLDPFGRIFAAEEIEEISKTQNYAILEKYTDVSVSGDSSEYDYVDIVTFDGESKRLYVDSRSYAAANVANVIPYLSGGTTSNGVTSFTGSALDGRVVQLYTRPSTGSILNISQVSTVTFEDAKYVAAANKLNKPLAADATVLDASEYVAAGASATTAGFKASSLAELSEDNTYDGILVYRNNNGWYENVIITKITPPEPPTPSTPTVTNAKYTPDSDFAVAAANSNINFSAVIDDEDIYTLRVMKDGGYVAEVLNISKDVVVSYKDGSSYTTSAYATNLITKGSAFFYTTNAYGLVDRIDIVLNGQTSFDAYRDTALTTLVHTPDNITSGIIDASDWYVNVNDSGLTANNKVIQLFVAPVILSGDDYVVFSTMASDSKGAYVDTNVEYTYGIAADANIYYYDISPYAPTNYTAFSGGTFYGIELANTSYEGKAYIDDVAGEENFDGLLQVAFVMAVDGVVTNALVIGE